MNFDYDVVIIGGAFSGAATALMLKRKRPEARVMIIEKTTAFDRKVGESTTEVSSLPHDANFGVDALSRTPSVAETGTAPLVFKPARSTV